MRRLGDEEMRRGDKEKRDKETRRRGDKEISG